MVGGKKKKRKKRKEKGGREKEKKILGRGRPFGLFLMKNFRDAPLQKIYVFMRVIQKVCRPT